MLSQGTAVIVGETSRAPSHRAISRNLFLLLVCFQPGRWSCCLPGFGWISLSLLEAFTTEYYCWLRLAVERVWYVGVGFGFWWCAQRQQCCRSEKTACTKHYFTGATGLRAGIPGFDQLCALGEVLKVRFFRGCEGVIMNLRRHTYIAPVAHAIACWKFSRSVVKWDTYKRGANNCNRFTAPQNVFTLIRPYRAAQWCGLLLQIGFTMTPMHISMWRYIIQSNETSLRVPRLFVKMNEWHARAMKQRPATSSPPNDNK